MLLYKNMYNCGQDMKNINSKRIVITGGGTGGHIFPCIAVIEELRKKGFLEIFWIGSRNGKEKNWAESTGVTFYGVPSGKLRRYFSIKNLFDIFRVVAGLAVALFILIKLKPQVVFSKGGFVSVPPVLASALLGIPIVTHESDITPGLATKIIARFASIICVSFEKNLSSFPGKKTVYTGNPVRTIIKDGNKERGVKFLNFQKPLPVVLVIGGSQGASSLNQAVWEMAERYELCFNLVHQCGAGNLKNTLNGIKHYRQLEFIGREIGDVLFASDIVISRAGAGAIYEIATAKKPCVLVPLPRSKSRGEQVENANYFLENGSALVIQDKGLNGKILFNVINSLLIDKKRLKQMGERAERLCKPDAEKLIAELILKLLEKN